jgi:tetratricopeptide (TPR) repeat protein
MSDARARHQRERELFEQAAALAGAARAAFLAAACGEDRALLDAVSALLVADEASHTAGVLRLDLREPGPGAAADLAAGTLVGPFRILGVLGRGGMGTVYDAEQDRPRRRVALKVLHSGVTHPAALRRFEFETEVLGRLRHPNIAQVHQAGTARIDGVARPYFAMERVAGVPLTDHAAQHRLDLAEKIALLIDVCDAVDHANHGGVIHRDLKPANILVDGDGRPKVLDFGIARAIDGEDAALMTRAGQVVGTLAYMSPEQAAGDPGRVGVASDVHALGVVGYELLTGALPYPVVGVTVTRALQVLAEFEPVPLARHGRAFRGDLDTIFRKALERDAAVRYATAAELRDDLRRFLRHETISARPPSAIYQVRKFARRHRGLVAGAALAALALVAGTIASVTWAVRAEAAEVDATRSARLSKRVTDFVIDLFRAAAPEVAYGKLITAKDLVEQGRRRIEAEFAGEPLLRAELGGILGDVFAAMGDYPAAAPLVTRALDDLRASVPANDPRLVDATYAMGRLAVQSGRLEEGRRQLEESLALHQRIGAGRDERVARCLDGLGSVAQRSGEYDAAMAHFADALAIRAAAGEPRNIARTLMGVAGTHQLRGDLPAAAAAYERALALLADVDDPSLTGALATNLGNLRVAEGRLQDAETLFRRALALGEDLLGKEHPLLVRRLNNVAAVIAQDGRFDEATQLLQRAIALASTLDAGQDDGLASALQSLGNVRIARDDPAGALVHWGRAAAIFERIGPRSAPLADVLENMAIAHERLQQHDEAAALRARVAAMRNGSGR